MKTVYLQTIDPKNELLEVGLDEDMGCYFWNLYATPDEGGAVSPEPIASAHPASRGEVMTALKAYAAPSETQDAVMGRICLDLDLDGIPSEKDAKQ